MTDEHKTQSAAWDSERKEIQGEMKSAVKEKEGEIMVLRTERDSLKDRLKKSEGDVDRLTTQSQQVLEQSRADREQAQDELRQANTQVAELTAVTNKYEAENAVVQGKLTRGTHLPSAVVVTLLWLFMRSEFVQCFVHAFSLFRLLPLLTFPLVNIFPAPLVNIPPW